MIQGKKKLSRKQISIIATSLTLVLLIISYTVISVLLSAGGNTSNGSGETSSLPEIKDGEGIYNNTAVAYPYVAKSKIVSVAVSGHKDAFVMSRPEGESYFVFYYTDENGELKSYYPSIMVEESDTSYSDFYAKETSDGLNAYKLDYLLAAIGALYFDERIELGEDRASQLNRYGLGSDERETVYFTYLDDEGNTKEIKIFIGDKRITGVGYYFMIEGRNYIYTSAASERFSYILGEFESFLHSRIVPQGLASDGIYEPYLTTDYKQWTNIYHGINSGGLGMQVSPKSEVIVNADILSPVYSGESGSDEEDGYLRRGYSTLSIDLGYINEKPNFKPLADALRSAKVGYYTDNEIVATVITNANEAKLGTEYLYEIYAIESVISEDGEQEEKGYPVGENNLVKVIYSYRLDGITENSEPSHAVIDLNADSVIPEEIREKIRASAVGDTFYSSDVLAFKTTYDENNSTVRNISLVVTDILLISRITEQGGISYLDTITEDSIVTYQYKYLVDGEEMGESSTATVDLSAITEGEDLEIKNALIGLGVSSNIDKTVMTDEIYCQAFCDFVTYRIRSVEGFVEKEMVVSFEFVNASARDPFYGESIYKNTLENKNKNYALDALACQNVTFLLGGIGTSDNSQISAGLSGSETVAVGLTPENLARYGLYDGYTVYFELPRLISAVGTGNNGADDFEHVDTLGTYLYISKMQQDGTRYIGSSLYDIIVKIEGGKFNFLECDFNEYWARTNLVMVNYKNLDKISVDLNMSDVYGSYEFDLEHKTIYILDDKHYDVKPEEGGTEYNFLTVKVRPLSSSASDNVFLTLLESEGRDSMDLANVYNRVAGEMFSIDHDTAGAAYFKKLLNMLYGVNYLGVLTEEETKAAFEGAPKVMSITFSLEKTPYKYTYDFYRVSDRRVMVHLYRTDPLGNPVDGTPDEVSGFYISNLGLRKIVGGFTKLLNGEIIDEKAVNWD